MRSFAKTRSYDSGSEAVGLFLPDAFRMIGEAEAHLRRAEQEPQGEMSPIMPELRSALYRTVHTLKGTAAMFSGGEAIVRSLHDLESVLAVQTEGVAWLPMAEQAVRDARRNVERLHREWEFRRASVTGDPEQKMEAPKGLLVRLAGEHGGYLFFPAERVIEILPRSAFFGRKTLCLGGAWVPVLGESQGSTCGVVLRKAGETISKNPTVPGPIHTRGRVVVAVTEILGIFTQTEAAARVGGTGGKSGSQAA